MDVDVGRLQIRCRGGAGDGARALAVRRRMEQVARGPLPAALARVLGDADMTIDRLDVPLDFDPLGHDAETIAVLWADRIRVSLAAAVDRAPTPGALGGSRGRSASGAGSGAADGLVRAQRWEPAEAGRRLVRLMEAAAPAALAGLARALVASGPEVLARLWAVLTASDRGRVLRRLEAAAAAVTREGRDVRDANAAAGRAGRRGPAPTPDAIGTPRSADPTLPAWHKAWRTLATVEPATLIEIPTHPPPDLLDAAAEATSTAPRTSAATPGLVLNTQAGGLVLLYPWLPSYLTRATATLAAVPNLHPDDARRLALIPLMHRCADTHTRCGGHPCATGGRMQHDPLVRVLAGCGPDADTADLAPHIDALEHPLTRLADEADALLRTFAGVLPGFQRSTPDYLRANLINRPARLEPLADTVHVTLPPAPLDVLVARLPFPLGTFALGWTDTIHVHLEVVA